MSSSVISLAERKVAQQSVHLTLGSLRKSQAVFYALAVPAPAQVSFISQQFRFLVDTK